MLYLGLVLGVVAGNIAAHAAHLDALRVYVATLILIVPALAGARLLYVAAEWRLYRGNLRRIWDRKDGGSIMYGGLSAALLFSVPLLRALHLSLPGFWDVASFTMLVGMFFTRIGCLLNGCCSGRASRRWGIDLPDHEGVRERRIPAQLLEAAWAAVLLIFAVAVRRSAPFAGALFLMICLGYGAGRLGMEFARKRPQRPGYSIAHVISLVITFVSISALTIYWKR
jgi:phosphatidylglycerol:prolipoprotein diacylglycerol transferase